MEEKSKIIGKQSVSFNRGVFISSSASIVGKKEGEGPLGHLFDMVSNTDEFGCKCWEEAESALQKEALTLALGKGGITGQQVRFLFGGDLLGQSIATTFGVASLKIPVFGLYGACSTCGEALLLASMMIAGGLSECNACVTSSHFASAEKEFRYPLEYGNQRPDSATWTVTGSGAFVLSNHREKGYRGVITGGTVGKIVDYGCKDSMNMGACMAPAAADTICTHFEDFKIEPDFYDQIITGDLGEVGQKLLFQLLLDRGYDISKNHMDCGMKIYDGDKQGTGSGGSGCGCAATVFSAYILKMLEEGKWKRVLFVPTGALLSKTSFNQGRTIPAIAHGISVLGPENTIF